MPGCARLKARWLVEIELEVPNVTQALGPVSWKNATRVWSSCGTPASSMTTACTTARVVSVKVNQSTSAVVAMVPVNVLPSVIGVGVPPPAGLSFGSAPSTWPIGAGGSTT